MQCTGFRVRRSRASSTSCTRAGKRTLSNEATEHMKHAYAQLNQYVESVRVEYLDAPIGKVF